MSYVGDPGLWADLFPDALVPAIIDLILTSWEEHEKPGRDEHEVPITRNFRVVLTRNKDLRKLPFRIDREVLVDNLQSGEELGRIDLRFTHGFKDSVYLAFECKRLCLPGKTLGSEYVQEGMTRFLTGQYASDLEQGGMIAYVMDGNFKRAVDAVQRNIRIHCLELKMVPPGELRTSSILPTDVRVRETLHNTENQEFRLHHVFLVI